MPVNATSVSLVEEGNLHVQMSTLRKVLGSEIIVSVPGRGYRFTAVAEASVAGLSSR